MAKFTPCTKKPTKTDKFIKYYNTKKNGGVSLCIQGEPVDKDCDVLCNCVGWVCGRFNSIYSEIKGTKTMKFPKMYCNAENFVDHAKEWGLKIGSTPKLGSIMVWQNNYGHVAIVEKIISDTEIMTSESQYGYFAFKNMTRKKGKDGNWGMTSPKYKFAGFIYNPAVVDEPKTTTKPTSTPTTKPTKPTPAKTAFKVGEKVKMKADAVVYGKSYRFASWVYKSTLSVREVNKNRIVISITKKWRHNGCG